MFTCFTTRQDLAIITGMMVANGSSRCLLLSEKLKKSCGGLGGENPGAFPQVGRILQQPFSLPESAQTLAVRACRAAGKSGNDFAAVSKFF